LFSSRALFPLRSFLVSKKNQGNADRLLFSRVGDFLSII
jgi:hypothetical protein